MQCELCGRECSCRPAMVDGVRMMVCPGCMKHGKGIAVETNTPSESRPILNRIRRPKEKDVYKGMDKELVSNFKDIIKSARQKKDLSREEMTQEIKNRKRIVEWMNTANIRGFRDVAKIVAQYNETPAETLKMIGKEDK